MPIPKLLLILCIAFVLFSCSEERAKNVQEHEITAPKAALEKFPRGEVLRKIECLTNKKQSYALYLPGSSSSKKLPVLIAFDSHARGHLPLEKYKGLAEEFGYILVGSNFSKNGIATDDIMKHIDNLLDDIGQRLRIDHRRIYAMGFSGGARVAVSMAAYFGNVPEVIGCAAGFPKTGETILPNFSYMGIVGDKDFNYPEMYKLDKTLEKQGFRHQLIVFDGKHEWPGEESMRKAFIRIELNAMRTGVKEDNDSLVTESDPSNVISEQKITAIFSEEAKIEQEYATGIAQHDLKWCVKKINGLQMMIDKEIDPVKKLSYQRVMAYLSLVSYMYSEKAISNNSVKEAKKYLAILRLVDPENPDLFYLSARWLNKQNEAGKAIKALQKAVKLGFDNQERLQNEEDFMSLHNRQDFKQLLSTID